VADFPYLPLFTGDYLSDTRHLSAQEHGAYLLLLMMAWRTATCSLPDDDALLARWAAVDKRTWQKIKPKIMAFWTNDPSGNWIQQRLTQERVYVSKRAEVARLNGARGGRPKSLKSKETHNPSGSSRVTQTETTHTHTHTKKDNSVKGAGAPLPNPEKELFRRGKEILRDAKAGGFIAKLLAATGRDAVEALGIIEMAAESENPREYIGAAIKGAKNGNGTYRRAGKSNGHNFFARMAGVQNDPAGRIKPSPEPSRGPTIDLPAKEVGRGPSDGFGGLLGLPNAK